MIADYLPLLSALVAFLFGLAAGKAWERYKLHEGRWIDRRKARQSPHYIQGLNFLVANQLDHAIEELSQAARVDEDAVEIHMILGNLYREKGHVGRAIQIHQQILQRPRISKLEHTYALLCLGLDFTRGGFVDRAHEAFGEVLRLDPSNEHALLQLQKLFEDQNQWSEAYRVRRELARGDEPEQRTKRHLQIQAFLENELGMQALSRHDLPDARKHFEAAIDLDAEVAPAYLNLGDVKRDAGDMAGAVEIWERLVASMPTRAHLVADRLGDAYTAAGRGRCLRAPVPAYRRRPSAGLARPPRALAAHAARRPSRRCPADGHRRAHDQSACAAGAPGRVGHPARDAPGQGLRRAIRHPQPRRRVLQGPAHLPAVPLPEQGTALAVPALPRVELVRRRPARPGPADRGHRCLMGCSAWD